MKRALVAAAALAGAALLLTACGERSEPTGAQVRLFPVTVDNGADGDLTLPAQPRRIAVLDPAARSIIEALGAGSLIVPLPAKQAQETAALRSAHPDLLIASTATATARLDKARAATGAPTYTAALDSLTGLTRSFHDLGLLVGQPLAGRQLVERLAAARSRVEKALLGKTPTRFFLDTGLFTTVPDDSYAGDLLRAAGGHSVGGTVRGPLDPAALRAANPELYLVSSDSGLTLADLQHDPHASKLDAVRFGRVDVIDSSLLQPGPDADKALLSLARLLHPDAIR